jgi:hypothetical protein
MGRAAAPGGSRTRAEPRFSSARAPLDVVEGASLFRLTFPTLLGYDPRVVRLHGAVKNSAVKNSAVKKR